MFYEIHILDSKTFECEADKCETPGETELIERVYHDEDGTTYYGIQHAADWAAEDAETPRKVLKVAA